MNKKYNYIKLELKLLPDFLNAQLALIKQGNPLAEQIQCVFTYPNENLIYFYPLLDFLDLPKEELSKITSFHYFCPVKSNN